MYSPKFKEYVPPYINQELNQPRVGGEGEGLGDGAGAKAFKHQAFISLDRVD